MSDLPTTPRSHRSSIAWAVILIAVGLMFLVGEFAPHWGARKTWPVLLIVIGLVQLFESGRPPRAPRGPRVNG